MMISKTQLNNLLFAMSRANDSLRSSGKVYPDMISALQDHLAHSKENSTPYNPHLPEDDGVLEWLNKFIETEKNAGFPYKPLVREVGKSRFGKVDQEIDLTLPCPPILRAFWQDNDLQEIQVVSTNLGMYRTFTKSYK